MRHSFIVALGTGILFLLVAFHRPIRTPFVLKVSELFNIANPHYLSCEADHSCGRKAQYLSPNALLARPYPPANPSNASVPKLIHQSWPANEIPPSGALFWAETWRVNHPGWEWVLWTEEDNQRLVDIHFPWFQSAYAQLNSNESRAAVARYMYMYAFGG